MLNFTKTGAGRDFRAGHSGAEAPRAARRHRRRYCLPGIRRCPMDHRRYHSRRRAARTSEVGTPGAPGVKRLIKGPFCLQPLAGLNRPGCCTQRNSAPYELGQRTSFGVAAGVVAHHLVDQRCAAMTYPLFAEEWHLTHRLRPGSSPFILLSWPPFWSALAMCPIISAVAPPILWGVGASLFGTLLLALAPDVLWLFAGRAFMGVGVGLTAGRVDRRDGGIQRQRSGEARRHDHNHRPSRRFRRGPAARRCSHSICSAAHAAELLGAVRCPGCAVCRGMVPAAPYRQRSPGPLASQNPLHTEPFAQRFRGRGGGGNYCLHARRTDPCRSEVRLPAISLDRPTRS